MNKIILLFCSGLMLGPLCLWAATPELTTENDRINYSVGYQVGGDFERQGVSLNPEALVRGIEDVLKKRKPAMDQEQMRSTLVALKKKIMLLQQQKKQAKQQQYLDEGKAFLSENAGKKGVTSLSSGLQYKVIKAGTGKKPKATDSVSVHYKGTLIDGSEFDSSIRRNEPAVFRVDGVIAGWTEALQLMPQGSKWRLYIPPNLAYGERTPLADRTLIFDVELLAINQVSKPGISRTHSN